MNSAFHARWLAGSERDKHANTIHFQAADETTWYIEINLRPFFWYIDRDKLISLPFFWSILKQLFTSVFVRVWDYYEIQNIFLVTSRNVKKVKYFLLSNFKKDSQEPMGIYKKPFTIE